jgi:hypothetical protein
VKLDSTFHARDIWKYLSCEISGFHSEKDDDDDDDDDDDVDLGFGAV